MSFQNYFTNRRQEQHQQIQEEVEKNDCLVLHFEEWEEGHRYNRFNKSKVDTSIYVVYDINSKTYILYGKRKGVLGGEDFIDYTLYFYKIEDVITFFSFTFCKDNNVSYTLFSFSDLIEYGESFDTSYSFDDFDERQSKYSEIFAYDNNKFNKSDTKKLLHLLSSESSARLNIDVSE